MQIIKNIYFIAVLIILFLSITAGFFLFWQNELFFADLKNSFKQIKINKKSVQTNEIIFTNATSSEDQINQLTFDNNGKLVLVDLSEQKLYLYNNNDLIKDFIVSSGAPETPTPQGEFKIYGKSPLIWSVLYEQYLPYALRFYDDYLIHEVPYGVDAVRDGLDKLGQPVSHGCVRLGIGDAEEVYEWADMGTGVVVRE